MACRETPRILAASAGETHSDGKRMISFSVDTVNPMNYFLNQTPESEHSEVSISRAV